MKAMLSGAERHSGEFVREDSMFRRWVRSDPGAAFPAASGRYHLYVSAACPWAHRTLIVRRLKGLEDAISVSFAHPFRDERGWAFPGGRFHDPVNRFTFLSEAYRAMEAEYEGRVSTPVLWDKVTGEIVNNESADIIQMFNSEFDAFAANGSLDLYPEELRAEIDAVNFVVYETVNDGVYRAGFASSQSAYEKAFRALFETLDRLEGLLEERRYLVGDRVTLADWRLFTTLVRFDTVYYLHFRCNGRRIVDHPNLWAYARELFQWPGVADTVDFEQIKAHYYQSHDSLNPKRLIPVGPLDVDFTRPHGRGDGVGPRNRPDPRFIPAAKATAPRRRGSP